MIKEKTFCPRCKSKDVEIKATPMIWLGAPQNWVCNKCGYWNFIFPKKEIKSKIRRKIKPVK